MLKGASPSTPVPPKMRPCSRRSEDETDVESQLVEGVDGEVCLAKELSQEPNAKLVMLRDRQGVFVPGLDHHDVRSSLPSYRPPRSLKLSDGFGT